MSYCEFHPEYQKHLRNDIGIVETEPLLNLQDELQWGLSYRDYKKKEVGRKTIPPKKSPIDIPFKICRERQKTRRLKHSKEKKNFPASKTAQKKLSLLEKSMLSQDKYMEYLSTPNPKYEEPPPKKRKKRCLIEPCSPRLVRLATPNKRRVYANWKDFYDRLPTEMLLRFEEILYANNCLEPRDARYYYKQLDKEKSKNRKTQKLRKLKKIKKKERGGQKWAKNEIEKTVKAIMDFIKEEPLFVLNYKQLLLSDGILNQLADKNILKKPKRNSKRPYKNTLIEISDKLALWMDTLIRFVDVQAVESDVDIPPISISSLEVSSEDEGESEIEDESESEIEDEGESEIEDEEGQTDEEDEMETEQGRSGEDDEELGFDEDGGDMDLSKEEFLQKFKGHLEEDYDEGEELEDFFGPLDIDQLEKLIKILSNCSDEFLDSYIDPDHLPDVTYKDVLNKLIELKKKLGEQHEQSFLEKLMLDWAMTNDPDKVDSKLRQKIKETAAILEESLRKPRPQGDENKRDSKDTGGENKRDSKDTGGENKRDSKDTGGENKRDSKDTGGENKRDSKDTGGENKRDSEATDGLLDPLEEIINMVSKSSEKYLRKKINSNVFPGVTYKTLLKKLGRLKENWDESRPGSSFIKAIFVEWAKTNEPEGVDEDLVKKIKAVSVVIEEWFRLKKEDYDRRQSSDIDLGEYDVVNNDEDALYKSIALIDKGDDTNKNAGKQNIDQIDRLIELLGKSPDEFLNSNVNEQKIPSFTHKDLLDQLIQVRQKIDPNNSSTSDMEEVLIKWVADFVPQKRGSKLFKKTKTIPDRLRPKIKEICLVLDEWVKTRAGEVDPLEDIINIVTKSPDKYLSNKINPNVFPGVTYEDLLQKLNKLKKKWDKRRPDRSFLEDILVEWAKNNEPEGVDEDMVKNIKAVAVFIEEWLKIKNKNSERRKSSEVDVDEDDDDDDDINGDDDDAIYKSITLIDTDAKIIDQIDRLIEILGKSPNEFLGSNVDEEKVPGLIYSDLLDHLIQLRQKIDPKNTDPCDMEEVLIKWVADFVSQRHASKLFVSNTKTIPDRLRPKIKEISLILDEWAKIRREIDKKEGEEYGRDSELSTSEEGEGIGGPYDVGDDHRFEHSNTQLSLDLLGGMGHGEDDVMGYPPSKEPTWKVEEGSGEIEGWEEEEGEEGMEKKVSVLYDKGAKAQEGEEGVIKGHKPHIIEEHSPDTVCCLSLKIWAVWLLEVTHNAHSWTKWVHQLIKQIREYAATVRGDVILPNGEKKVLLKKEWREFINETEKKVIAWRQYSAHIKDLSVSIIDNFRGKRIMCCPKCLQDHLIKNVVSAHETLRALTEAMNCAAYWRRNFDSIVEMTANLSQTLEQEETEEEGESSETGSEISLAEQPIRTPCVCRRQKTLQSVTEEVSDSDEESIYELEEIETNVSPRGSQQPHDDPSEGSRRLSYTRRKS